MKYTLFLIRTALFNFSRNKGRAFLTSLGILIGVLSVVLLIAAGIGLKNYIQNQFESLGSNLIYLFPGRVISQGGGFQDPGALAARFTEGDIRKIERLPKVEYVVPANEKNALVTAQGNTESTQVLATTPEITKALNLEPEYGVFFTQSDILKRAKKVVIGPELAKNLFGRTSRALGNTLRISDKNYKIIGVLKPKGGGALGGPSFDNITYMPYRSSADFDENKKFYTVYVKIRTQEEIPQAKIDLQNLMMKKYDEDEFQVVEQTEVLNIVTSIFSILNSILVAIGSISLLVGGIGIMNIMYATVTERIKEIGIRRAIGASKRDILVQFLTEAMLLSLFGGVSGLVLSWIIVQLIYPFFPAEINLIAVAAALGISSGIGIFFGVFPAKQAADLTPIEAIRYE